MHDSFSYEDQLAHVIIAHLSTGFDSFTDKQCYQSPRKQQTQTQLPPDMTNVSNARVVFFTHNSQPIFNRQQPLNITPLAQKCHLKWIVGT